jgi:ribonuclease G
LPFKWFRRRKPEREQAPTQAAAPPSEVPETTAVAEAADPRADTTSKPKRRRGTRGGKGRKKPGAAVAESGEKPERPERQPARSQAEERRAQQRKERSAGGQRRRRELPRRAPLPAAKRELLVSVDVSEQRVAVLEDGRVAEVYLERPERRSIAGNIYLGTVDNVLPGMEAAFVEIGLEKNGFLYVDEIVRPELEGHRHGKRIQDLLSRGEQVLVQAVKDPMKSKGARLTMEISLPGRFVVFVPNGEGLGVSRRLEDEERARLKDILKRLAVKQGGVIVRTAAEGASAEDIERDLVFLQKLWKTISTQATKTKAPALIYQEAELPLRVTRDLFTENFERAYVDDDKAFRRITGYLKKTSPHMVDRVVRYKDKEPLLERDGVDAEIRSTLSRRVDLPSGGYLVFDYAEAFTVIDVNTGRFVGSRSKTSASRLEDTITKNNLEAVKEVVRQLRLRDIGGIIVIDFIDMANPKNREAVEDALRTELERDRTKTYVVEISPLGLVEMTRQNVTEGPREILTRKCPICAGDGVVISEQSAAIDLERRLRALARGSRVQAFRVEVNARVAALLVGPGATRLQEIEAAARRRFFLEPKENVHVDHFVVLQQGKVETIAPDAPFAEGATVELQPVEVGLHDSQSAVAKLDGYDVVIAGAARLVGKKVKAQIARIQPGTAYATMVKTARDGSSPITAEGEAEKPTRKAAVKPEAEAEATPKPARKQPSPAAAAPAPVELTNGAETESAVEAADSEDDTEGAAADGAATPRKKTRRGSRGGRKRKTPTIHVPGGELDGTAAAEAVVEPAAATEAAEPEPVVAEAEPENGAAEATSENGAQPPAKKKTRRGSRGGRNRRKKPAAEATAEEAAAAAPAETTDSS